MNKTELIQRVAEETGFSRKNVETGLNAAIALITKALAEEEGSSPYLFLYNNGALGSSEYYRECFVNALRDGLRSHTHNKYFVWQCCFYLTYSATYYPVYEALEDASGAEKEMERLLQLVKTNFEGSLIFRPFIEEVDYYDWVPSLNKKDKAAMRAEIVQFHLCENSADENVKNLFA